ncbi:hypothetical protein D3C73_1584080 [compost metagenome]
MDHGKTGFLADPERLEADLTDHICAVLTDGELQAELGAGCLERVREYFAWEHAAGRWLGLLEEYVTGANHQSD